MIVTGDSTWKNMDYAQHFRFTQRNGVERTVKVHTACTPSGSLLSPSRVRRPAYERLIEALAGDPDERPVRWFEFPVAGGSRNDENSHYSKWEHSCSNRRVDDRLCNLQRRVQEMEALPDPRTL